MWRKFLAPRSWAVVGISAIGLTILVGVASNLSQEEAPPRPPAIDSEQRLSVEETLGAIFDPGIGPVNWKYYARANPGALDAIYRVLDNEELNEFHGTALQVLGYIGGRKHVSRIEKEIERIKQVSGWLPGADEERLHVLFDSLGIMCGREIDEACALVEKMMDREYWKDARFRLEKSQDPEKLNSVNETIMRLMFGYSLSLDPDIEEHSQSILTKINDAKQLEAMKLALSRKLLLGHGRNTRADEKGKVTQEEREELASYFNGDLENPGPARFPR